MKITRILVRLATLLGRAGIVRLASLAGVILVLSICLNASFARAGSAAWPELVVPLAPGGRYALVVGISRRPCPPSVYQTYGASGCEPFSRCGRICPYIIYRTPRGEHGL